MDSKIRTKGDGKESSDLDQQKRGNCKEPWLSPPEDTCIQERKKIS